MTEVACMEWRQGQYTVSCDPAKLDVAAIARFLSSSYWATGIPAETVAREPLHKQHLMTDTVCSGQQRSS